VITPARESIGFALTIAARRELARAGDDPAIATDEARAPASR
jgi:hypothetical protein